MEEIERKYGDVTLEDVRRIAESVFNSPPPENKNERGLKLTYRCKQRGVIDFMSTPFHCGDENCSGCNTHYERLNEIIRNQFKQFKG